MNGKHGSYGCERATLPASAATLHRRSSSMILASTALRSSASALAPDEIDLPIDAKPFSDLLVSVFEERFMDYECR